VLFVVQLATANNEAASVPTPTVVIQSSVTVASFNASLDGIVAWLADASGTLAAQTPVANDIDSLKEQFHHHEVGLLPFRGRVYVTARCPSDCLSVCLSCHSATAAE